MVHWISIHLGTKSQDDKSLTLRVRTVWCLLFLKGLLKVRWCWIVLYWTALEDAEEKGFWERGQVSTHGIVNMALGCSDRSQLSLQHLLSAGIYYQPQKPTQAEWTLATSCSHTLPPYLHAPPLAASSCRGYKISRLSCLHCGAVEVTLLPLCVSDVRRVRALWPEHSTASHLQFVIFPWGIAAGQSVTTDPTHTPSFSL